MRRISAPAVPGTSRLRLSLGLVAAAAAAACMALLAAPDATAPQARVTRAQYRMGTVLEIDAVASDRARAERAVAAAFGQVELAEKRLSNWRPDSELSLANREAGTRAFPLSRETFWSLRQALALARETGGAFDPTVGAVTRALGLTGETPRPDEAARMRHAVGWSKATLDETGRTLRFSAEGSAVDSGAFGKGEALDRASAALRRGGVVAARMNFGGQIALLGAQTPQGRRLGFDRVAIAAPDASGREISFFFCPDGSISTSGDAEKPGHLIDPRTGEPAAFHGSVTVAADTALRADALSTALFVMGPREGVSFANRRGIAALFLFRSPSGWQRRASRQFDACCAATLERAGGDSH